MFSNKLKKRKDQRLERLVLKFHRASSLNGSRVTLNDIDSMDDNILFAEVHKSGWDSNIHHIEFVGYGLTVENCVDCVQWAGDLVGSIHTWHRTTLREVLTQGLISAALASIFVVGWSLLWK